MSFTFDLVINPIVLVIAGVVGILVGYLFNQGRVAKAQSKIQKLESDLVSANHETLEAQRAYVVLEAQIQGQASPVIPMKLSTNSKDSKEKATK